MKPTIGGDKTGLTRIEVLAVFLVMGLALTAVVLPAFGVSPQRSRAVHCANNLRQIGRASQAWAVQNDDKFPWLVRAANGGLNNINGESPISANPYVHFGILSNELASPRELVCPSDVVKKVARDFSASPEGGFFHLNYQSAAQSYFVGLEAGTDRPESMLSGDRNVRVSRLSQCAIVVVPSPHVDGQDPGVAFTNGIHGAHSQVGLSDGAVRTGDGSLLRRLIANGTEYDPGAIGGPALRNHLLIPGSPPATPEPGQ